MNIWSYLPQMPTSSCSELPHPLILDRSWILDRFPSIISLSSLRTATGKSSVPQASCWTRQVSCPRSSRRGTSSGSMSAGDYGWHSTSFPWLICGFCTWCHCCPLLWTNGSQDVCDQVFHGGLLQQCGLGPGAHREHSGTAGRRAAGQRWTVLDSRMRYGSQVMFSGYFQGPSFPHHWRRKVIVLHTSD